MTSLCPNPSQGFPSHYKAFELPYLAFSPAAMPPPPPTFLTFVHRLLPYRASLVAQLVKNPPAMWETWVQSLGWEDPLEKEVATHSNILAWRIPWTEEPGGL